VLAGVVLDPAGRAVVGARLDLEPQRRTAYTGSGGEFRLERLPAGRYSLNASAAEFEPLKAHPVEVTSGATATVRLQFQALRSSHIQVEVIGGNPEVALREIPGSAFLISREELTQTHPIDSNEVLRRVPGVHVREDSGPVGMRLNIGIRGLNPDRSRTLLVLEDGLPLSLAPYGEPEMYYSPPIDRMSRVEILKGSGSILHGPQTIGGVLNFITPDPPPHPEGSLELVGGQRGFFLGQASYGGSKDGSGWYLNLLRKQGDGWRDFYFKINDLVAKLNFTLTDRHRLGVKAGVYDEGSNSTYLGLTESMYRSHPEFNPVPDDRLLVRRYSGSLAHQLVVSPRALLSSSAFAYTTTRNWRRQDFDRSPVRGLAYRSVVGNELFLRDSSGNNNREFDVAGAESRLSVEHSLFGRRQRLETGLRYVYEEHRDRRIDGSTFVALSGIIREDEIRNGSAASAWVQNRIFVTDRFTITPGLRLENYDYTRHILRQPVNGVPADVDIRKGDGVFKPIPGIGATFQPAAPLTLFAGVHRGFAPPRVKDAITRAGVSLQLDAELSWNYEAGARLSLARGLRAEGTFFTTDFENQIIPASQSGGATSTLINAGRTFHRGAEFSFQASSRRGLYAEIRHTWLPVARFSSGIYQGNRLPYAPEHNFGLLTGYRHRRGFSIHVDGARAGAQFGDNRQTAAGSADGTVGLLPAYWVWNLSAGQGLRRERYALQPFVSIKNLADARYISSRAPQGIQPGLFRQVNAGVKFRF
jgi:Fe(3+) dicitrate transport protein